MSAVAKPKRRNSEKRKEKSRDAARCRRNQETGIFYELAHELPISYSLLSQLDKASVIRLSITHLKLRQLLTDAKVSEGVVDKLLPADIVHKLDQQYYRSIDGFLIVIASQGEIVYISENVEKFLGLTQVDMLGHNATDFAHPCDHDELQDLVLGKQLPMGCVANGDDDTLSWQRALFVRMKCTLTSKGRNVNIKSAAFKVIHLSGKVIVSSDHKPTDCGGSWTVLIGRPVPGLNLLELALDKYSFVSRHSLDLRFLSCDDEMTELLGYSHEDIVGNSVFKYHHALDADVLDKAYKALYVKGQSMTGLYRFLAKNGGYVWMETRATVIGDSQLDRARSILCINHVISEIECHNLILADVQLPRLQTSSSKPLQQTTVAKQQPTAIVIQPVPVTTAVAKQQQAAANRKKQQKLPPSVVPCRSKAPTVKLNPPAQSAAKQPLCVISNFLSQQNDKQQQQTAKKNDDENDADVVIDVVDDSDDDDTEASSGGMQFMTEKLLSSRGVVVSSSLLSSSHANGDKQASGVRGTLRNVSSCSSLDNILDDLDCGLDMRAPYIPLEDMIFAASSQSSDVASSSPHQSTSSPIDLTVCSANTLDVDVMSALFSCARPPAVSSTSKVDSAVDSAVDRPLSQATKRPLSDHLFILPASKLFRGNLIPSDSADPTTTAAETPSQPEVTTSSPTAAASTSVSGSSVLLNLLTTGVDSNWGYKLCSNQPNNEVEGTANAALTSLLRHLLSPSSPEPSNTAGGSSGNAGVNCVSGSELLFHMTSLPTGDK